MNQHISDYLFDNHDLSCDEEQLKRLENAVYSQPGKRCSDELADLLNLLRSAQKDFFKSKPGSLLEVTSLEQSKALEKELDNFLKERAMPKQQPQLF